MKTKIRQYRATASFGRALFSTNDQRCFPQHIALAICFSPLSIKRKTNNLPIQSHQIITASIEAEEIMASEKRKKKESKKLKENKKHKMEESAAEENDTVPGDVGENKDETPIDRKIRLMRIELKNLEKEGKEMKSIQQEETGEMRRNSLNEKEEDETTEVKKSKKKEKKSKKKKNSKAAEANDEESATKAQAEGKNADDANDGTNDGANKADSEEEAEPKAPSKSDDSDEDSEDDELMAAAAAWAQQEQTGGDKDIADKITAAATPKSFSLHITQLPFDAIELDIRQHFSEKGCVITSIRLVYDKDEHGRNALFRGVAFMDLLDQASYDIALKLNRSKVRGRKLNIRPTRSKEELANIVSQTQQLVKAKILNSRDDDADEKAKSKGKKKKSKADEKKAKKKATKAKHRKEGGITKTDPGRKLTKQERNRRAAIIMNRRK
jgi:hypothetical protein